MTYISYNNVNRSREYYGHERIQVKIYRLNYSISMELWNRQIKFIVTEIRLKTKYTGEVINEKT